MAIFLSCAPSLPFRNFPRFSHPAPAESWHRTFLQTIYKWKELKSFILLSGAGKLMLLVQTKFNFYFIDYCSSSQSQSFWLPGFRTNLPHISAPPLPHRKHWPDECEGGNPFDYCLLTTIIISSIVKVAIFMAFVKCFFFGSCNRRKDYTFQQLLVSIMRICPLYL